MDITLRKATKVRSKLENRLKELRTALVNTDIQVNALDASIEVQLAEASETWKRNFARQGVAKGVLTSIRNKIASKNSDSYISVRITEMAAIKTQRALLAEILHSDAKPSAETLAAQVTTARATLENSNLYGNNVDITIDFLTAEDLAFVKKLDRDLEKAAETTHEEVEKMNSNLTITLTDEEVAHLTAEEIL